MQSESTKELAIALARAQGEMKAALRDSTNPFFHSKYADLASAWDACREPLTKNGLSVVQTTEIEGESVRLKTTLLHASGEWISGELPIKPVKDDPQGMGSAMTYTRRYGLMAMVGIAPEDDDGNAASREKTRETSRPKPTPVKVEAEAKEEDTGTQEPAKDPAEMTEPEKEFAELPEMTEPEKEFAELLQTCEGKMAPTPFKNLKAILGGKPGVCENLLHKLDFLRKEIKARGLDK